MRRLTRTAEYARVCVTLAVSSSNEVSPRAGDVALVAARQMRIFSTLTLSL